MIIISLAPTPRPTQSRASLPAGLSRRRQRPPPRAALVRLLATGFFHTRTRSSRSTPAIAAARAYCRQKAPRRRMLQRSPPPDPPCRPQLPPILLRPRVRRSRGGVAARRPVIGMCQAAVENGGRRHLLRAERFHRPYCRENFDHRRPAGADGIHHRRGALLRPFNTLVLFDDLRRCRLAEVHHFLRRRSGDRPGLLHLPLIRFA